MVHPLFGLFARVHLRGELRDRGLSHDQIRKGASVADDDTIQDVADAHGVAVPDFAALALVVGVPGAVGAAFDGHIWADIKAFFDTPLGKIILKALVAMALAMLGL